MKCSILNHSHSSSRETAILELQGRLTDDLIEQRGNMRQDVPVVAIHSWRALRPRYFTKFLHGRVNKDLYDEGAT